jgi:hypothetical protein
LEIPVNAPTYDLRPSGSEPELYFRAVARLANEVLVAGTVLDPVLDAYGKFVEAAREQRRTRDEYLLEALTLGVLWRARGIDATRPQGATRAFVEALAARRRAGCAKPRDGSTSLVLSLDAPFEAADPAPSLDDVDRLLTWLVAAGEYDDEVERLEGWRQFLRSRADGAAVLEELVWFAVAFEGWSDYALGIFTDGVQTFFRDALPRRRWREDTIQCARRRTEYHLAMLGAEILNRAWRPAFLACERHVVVMPGCMRRRDDAHCRAERNGSDLRCTGCVKGCAVETATRVAERAGAEAVAVIHGSDFSRFLRSPALAGGNVGIVGVACVPGLLGAGWRARAAGLPAQCVPLEASGCAHWRDAPAPTAMHLAELARLLATEASAPWSAAPTVLLTLLGASYQVRSPRRSGEQWRAEWNPSSTPSSKGRETALSSS